MAPLPPPLDIADGVFRAFPHVHSLQAAGLPGPVSRDDGDDDGMGNVPAAPAAGWHFSTQDVVYAYREQGSPTPLRVHLPVSYPTLPPRLQRLPLADAAAPALAPPPALLAGGVAASMHAPAVGQRGTGDDTCADEGQGTPRTSGMRVPVAATTPASALAGLTINPATSASGDDGAAPGLTMLANAANSPMDDDMYLDPEDGPRPGDLASRAPHMDRPIPGFEVSPEELTRQQQTLVGLQLAHDEARARQTTILNPKAQFYTRRPHLGPVVDPMTISGYAPMEIDGQPLVREPLAHARVLGTGSDASDNDLYHLAPLEENLPDDPPGAPRVEHLYTADEQEGMRLLSGERRYYHDVPIRNSAAVSAAMNGATADVPRVWAVPDVVRDAYHLTGGHAAPPQPAALPYPTGGLQFMLIPAAGIPALHFDDPETLYKGLAAERVHVVFRQPQCSMVLVRIYNGGVPRAHNVKQQSDALAEAITAVINAADFIIVPPAQAWNHELSQQDQPMTWLVLRLTPAQVRTLVRQQLWSSVKITFMVFNRDLRFGRFIGRIGYYTHNVDQDIELSIRRTFAGPLILPSIRSLVASHPQILPVNVDPAVQRVLNSLRIIVVTYPNGNIIANVYCDSPTFSVESWRTWVAYVHSVPFWSDLNPTGSFLRSVRCGGCSGADHPTFMCPYALLTGWNGPTPGAATIEGPVVQAAAAGSVQAGRGSVQRGPHPYRGGNMRGRRGRGRGF
ncbi:hypothetical protein C8T65DRAFT_696873 [Cerioporus squamosus]|nr:hypothetical protein C8T65DRAFT_696873 [Cerioporus squamosus]